MILLDTNVVVDALNADSEHHKWAIDQIVDAVSGEGGAVNAIILAELCGGKQDSSMVESELKRFGLQVLDVPAAAGPACGKAYRSYKTARAGSGGGAAPAMPLPDFFIGAQAEIMSWKISTRDPERYAKYFPSLNLLTP
jgi:predicted nucleic acid-binding protein